MAQTRDEVIAEAGARKERIRQMIIQDPPVPFNRIKLIEGMHDRACRLVVKEIEKEEGIKYMGTPASKDSKETLPYGLTQSSQHLRGRLADHLYQLRQRGNNHGQYGRNQVAPVVGLNARQQVKAEERPFAHDWTLSQIERLARAMGEDPREFLLKCLTT